MIFLLIIIPAIIVGSFSANGQNSDLKSPSPILTHSQDRSPSPAAYTSTVNISPTPIFYESNITVYIKDKDEVVEMDLEEYVKGVVAAEMPLNFELEALKAQAVVARTYAYRRMFFNVENDGHPDAFVCTDSEHCQSWTDPEKLLDRLGGSNNSDAVKKVNKLKDAVESTKGIIITYDGKPIDALYHSNSGGITEDASEVWAGRDIPYLKCVKSEGETIADVFKTTYEISYEDFIEKLENEYSDIKINKTDVMNNIKEIERSKSNRITKITIGNKVLTGRDLRRIFQLRSTNIWFSDNQNGKIIITTYGNGHGVGLSQYGANARALEKMNYQEIIKYYYNDVNISRIMN